MWIISNILLIGFSLVIGTLLTLYLLHLLLFSFGWKRNAYARKKCEEQKKACAENFKNKSRDNTKYRTAVLNTKNVVSNE